MKEIIVLPSAHPISIDPATCRGMFRHSITQQALRPANNNLSSISCDAGRPSAVPNGTGIYRLEIRPPNAGTHGNVEDRSDSAIVILQPDNIVFAQICA